MIPKTIHYCWFGGNPKSEIIEKCIASWKKYCPDWEIIEWNESNFDISMMPFTREAYAEKKWAFVSDVARLYAVYEYGGIYMDTDVELLQGIDEVCQYDAMFVFETNLYINTGMGFGAKAHHSAVEKMLETYRNRTFIKENGKYKLCPCPKLNTDDLRLCYPTFENDGTTQVIDGVCVLSYGEYSKYAKHYQAMSWMDGERPKLGEYKDTKLKRFLRRPVIVKWVEKHLGKRFLTVYIFLSYDLLEMGPWYYVKRKLTRNNKK